MCNDPFIASLFGPEGRLAEILEHYEPRPAQQQMALRVAQAVRDEQFLLIEASTGTGKTLAYLTPLLAIKLLTDSSYPITVSTATRALQDQILDKDVPLLQQVLGRPFSTVVLKGRANYLCLYRLRTLQQRGLLLSRSDGVWLRQIEQWARQTESGDRDELTDLPEQIAFWRDISAYGEQCLGQQCEDLARCFLFRARRLAMQADLVVVNHHLFFADLSIKDGGFGEILPSCQVAVFDEAHRIPDVVTSFFGIEVSNYRIVELLRDTRQEFQLVGADDPVLLAAITDLELETASLRQLFPDEESRGSLESSIADDPTLERVLVALEQSLYRLGTALEPHRPRSVGLASCGRRAEELLHHCGILRVMEDRSYVYWFETRGRGLFLRASPLETGATLRELLFPRLKTAVFTSATLTTATDDTAFRYITNHLGAPAERTATEQLPPSFDYQHQSLLYLPTHLPAPDHPDFADAVATEIELLLQASAGRALCLFTSLRMVDYVRRALAGRIDYPLLVQGDRPKRALLESFRTDVSSVLLASASFWEGVDVPGEALSLVIIDRLPFPSPADPIMAARSSYWQSLGGKPFRDLYIPQAILSLKQGLGRLLRRSDDRGVMAILDTRLTTRRYGGLFRAGLPPMSVTHDRADIQSFLASSSAALVSSASHC
ncbi:MAG: ATP-dependent DNA helicase [Magnetococcales bacterium]|nr:ATP-dependent DNA helicase [Magnetococcales bacterium]